MKGINSSQFNELAKNWENVLFWISSREISLLFFVGFFFPFFFLIQADNFY